MKGGLGLSRLQQTSASLGRRRFAYLQALLILVITGSIYAFVDTRAAYSALLGGLIAAIPSQYFAYQLFRYQGAHAAKQIVQSFYIGEALKGLLTALMFIIVFVLINVSAPVLFMSYIIVQALHWTSPWIFRRPKI